MVVMFDEKNNLIGLNEILQGMPIGLGQSRPQSKSIHQFFLKVVVGDPIIPKIRNLG
jgi:hypothetical protein